MVKFIPYNTMDGKKYYKAKGYIGTDPDTGKKRLLRSVNVEQKEKLN